VKLPEYVTENGYKITSSQLLIYLLVENYWDGENTREIQQRTGIISHIVVREAGRLVEEYPAMPEKMKKSLLDFGEALGVLEESAEDSESNS
jgi:hypothetical protein